MPTYRVDTFSFHLWEGPPPAVPTQHVSTHTRPGINGVTHTRLGSWGDPITFSAIAYYATYQLALDARARVIEPLIDKGVIRVWHASIDFLARYRVGYKVLAVDVREIQSVVRVFGSGLNLANATRLTAELTMLPHQL